MSWGAVAGAGIGLAGSLMGGGAGSATVPKPWSVSGPAGKVVSDKKKKTMTLTQAPNPFSDLFKQLGLDAYGNAAGAQNDFLYGASPEIAEAYKGLFGQGLNDRIQGQYDLLSDIAAPGERRMGLELDDQLFSRGQLGTSGGAERFRALQEALLGADKERQLSAVGLGRQEALDRFTGATQGVSQGMAGAGMNLDIGNATFGGLQALMKNLFEQAGIGIASGGAQAPGAAMYDAQQRQAPWMAANQFLQNSGLFAPRAQNTMYPGGTIPMVSQPNLGPIVINDRGFRMPSGDFGL